MGYRVPGGWKALDPAAFGPYWKRQYMFVAATMPSIMLSDVGSEIQRMFPHLEWVASELLHQSKPRLHHAWLQVSAREWGMGRGLYMGPPLLVSRGGGGMYGIPILVSRGGRVWAPTPCHDAD